MPEGLVIPNTTDYLFLGLAVVAIVMLVLIGSMVVRSRNLNRDLEMIQTLTEDER
jgi:hypothetical protein